MHTKGRFPNVIFHASLRPESTTLAILVTLLFLIFVLLFVMLTPQPAQAQTYHVIYTFDIGQNGVGPCGRLVHRCGR